MRLVTFTRNGEPRLGALRTQAGVEQVVDLNQADSRLPGEMIPFLEGGRQALAIAAQALDAADEAIKLAEVSLLAPVPRPGKIMCIGLNYRDHAEETGADIPDYPTVFTKYANAVIAPGQAIVIPRVTYQVDYEAELAVVIGKRGRYISEADALDHVAGYTCMNDVSGRDYQKRTSQWTIGKTFDTFAPMGPVLVTADEIPDPQNLDICIRVSGEKLQSSNTKHLIFTVQKLVESLSEVMTLEPGDVISTGTPSGVGFARKPPRFLQPGDVTEVEIEGIGTLTNPVVAEAAG